MKNKISKIIDCCLAKTNHILYFTQKNISFPWLCIILFLSYGALVFNFAIGIDDESTTYYLDTELIRYGRIGGCIMNQIFPSFSLVSHWTSLIGMIFCVFDIILWCYIMDREIGGFGKYTIMFSLSTMISFPYIAKYAIFNGNLTSMGYVLLFTILAFDVACNIFSSIDIKKIALLIFFLFVVFLFEKAYIIFFCQCVASLLLFHVREKKQKNEYIKKIILLGICVIIAFILSRLFIKFYQYYNNLLPTNYSDSYILYDFSGIKELGESIILFLRNALASIYNKGLNIFSERVYIISVVLLFLFATYESIREKNIWISIMALCNIVLSYSVYIVTGNAGLPERIICFNYAFLIGLTIMYLGYMFRNKKSALCVLYCIMLLLIGNQSREMAQIYNNKNITFEKDKQMAESLLNKIEETCGTTSTYHKPVIFLGFPDNLPAVYDDVEKSSIFIWDRNSNTSIEEHSRRIYGFYDCLGYHLQSPTDTIDFYKIRQQISNMNAFPQNGSILNEQDYILVKLGNSLCEVLHDFEDIDVNTGLQGDIEWFDYNNDNRTLAIGGWLTKIGRNSYDNNISLILKNSSDSNDSYRLRTNNINREDITQYFSDGYNYDNCGINSFIFISDYVKNGTYGVYLELKSGENTYLFDTKNIINIKSER